MIRTSGKVGIYPENTPIGKIEIPDCGESAGLVPIENLETEAVSLFAELNPRMIQFYFCLDGSAELIFLGGRYRKNLGANQSYMLYNPEASIPHEVTLATGTRLLAMMVSVKQLHEWFLDEEGELAFLNNDNINQKLYAEAPISSSLAMVIGPLFLVEPPGDTRNLFYRAKVMEVLSLYFARGESESDQEKCPFLHDEANVEKIREAKRLLISNMIDPPGIKELSRLVGLNEYQLKVGFKNIYGNTVYKYLTDHRMDQARRMLDTGNYLVNEAAAEVGYSNPSHFIAAFKKKYGFTPKKYLGLVKK